MKNVLLFFIAFMTVSSCRKDKDIQKITEEEPPIEKIKLERTVAVSVEGFVFGNNAEPLANAKVTAGNTEVYTNDHGFFSLTDVLVPDIAGAVTVSHENYFTTAAAFAVDQERPVSLSIRLAPNTIAGSFNTGNGGIVTLENGSKLIFAPNSVVKKTGGAYSGEVQVAMTFVDPAETESYMQEEPGNRTGLNKKGILQYTESYGMVGAELRGADGELLQVAPGSKVQINIPVSPDWSQQAPAQAGLWSLDEEFGLWQEEGVLVKNGNMYTGEVTHFSFWQAAQGTDLVSFKALIVDESNTPIGGAGVSINYAGSLNSAAAGYGRADNDGFVTGYIPANRTLSLRVGGGWAICADGEVVKTFTTSGQDIDLGTLTGSVSRWMMTLEGTLLNCENNPVQQGYIYTYGKGFYHKIPVVNGTFSFSGLVCDQSSVYVVGVDETNNQQSDPFQFTASPGTKELELQACAAPATTYLTFSVDGEEIFNKEESNHQLQIAGIYTFPPNGTSGSTNTLVCDQNWKPVEGLYFVFAGLNVPGQIHTVEEIFLEGNNNRLITQTPIPINITSYGKTGGFIEGNFEGVMYDWTDGVTGTTPRQVSCSFKIRRII
ncbi:MAG: carboxypeptidase regulatory-like domain-containing protein [Sphingobacteriales bacterium]|nr:carboxypeptidase regulatory-like domain-containing protein [Sphingobacteriales bacterium]